MGRKKKGETFKKITRVLPVELTDKEIQERGEDLADLEQQLQGAREESAADAARWRERKKALAISITKASGVINARQEDREVSCELRPDYRRNVMETVRLDTDEMVEERALSFDERQQELGLGGKAKKEEPEAEDDGDHPGPFATLGDLPAPKKERRKRKKADESNGVGEDNAEAGL